MYEKFTEKKHFILLSTAEFCDENTLYHLGNTGVLHLKGSRCLKGLSISIQELPAMIWQRTSSSSSPTITIATHHRKRDFHKKGTFEIYYPEHSMYVMGKGYFKN